MLLQHRWPDPAVCNSTFALLPIALQCCDYSPHHHIVAATRILADGHTVSNAPDLFRPPKLSGTGPGQYWGGGPPGKPLGCCQLFAASFPVSQSPSCLGRGLAPPFSVVASRSCVLWLSMSWADLSLRCPMSPSPSHALHGSISMAQKWSHAGLNRGPYGY